MNRKIAIIITLQACLIILLFWGLVYYGKDEYETFTQTSDEQIETNKQLTNKQDRGFITLALAVQQKSEIKTSVLKTSTFQANTTHYGTVVNIENLIELRSRYMAAKAELLLIKTNLMHAQEEYTRFHILNSDDKNISDQVLAAALTEVKIVEAKMQAARLNANGILDLMRQTWGEKLTQLTIDNSNLIQNLANNNEALIEVTLAFDAPEPAAGSQVNVTPFSAPLADSRATFLSRAPANNGALQGKTYFYHTKNKDLRKGTQVTVLFTDQQIKNGSSNLEPKENGLVIPNEAVVWYGGKAWVYRKNGDEKFERLPLSTNIETENGWFYQNQQKNSLKANDAVVTNGAQLLLSEEFKSQITNENDD